MINLPLGAGYAGEYPLWNRSSQESLQFTFLIIAIICIPLMLFPKPLILWF